ncbi:hypothetical protein [Oryza sativa Japonica Group]|uniref:Uncharacterized protein n=1 Tax=Oryza sativa subsp. japonica TaxID=39947 RepID=Q657W1_ORYSJ|nr:hypothetical protein [Oryza sativa Japonica Group]
MCQFSVLAVLADVFGVAASAGVWMFCNTCLWSSCLRRHRRVTTSTTISRSAPRHHQHNHLSIRIM